MKNGTNRDDARGLERKLRGLLADNVKRLRTARTWSQEHCAEELGLHWTHVQKLEYGTVNVTLKTLARIAAGFGVELGELLTAGKGR